MPENGPPNELALSVGCGGAVFAEEVALGEGQGWRLGGGIKGECVEGHIGDDFECEGVFDGFGSGGSPGKRAVVAHEDGWDFQGIDSLEALDDDISGLPFVGFGNLGGRQGAGHRNLAAKVVGVGGSKQRDAARRLGEGDRLARVSVDDRADAGESQEEPAVCGSVRRGVELSLYDASLEIHNDHVLGFERRVGNAAWFDGKNSGIAVTNADIAEGEIDQARSGQRGIGGAAFLPNRLVTAQATNPPAMW